MNYNTTSGTFLTAEWKYLVMLNYTIDPSVIEPIVPRGTEIDFHEGRAYVSMVGFLFLHARVMGVAIPFHRNFEEVNLRTYVRYRSDDGWRRGVVFVKEIVPRRAIALVARMFFNEHYVAMPMHHFVLTGSGREDRRDVVEYGWRGGEGWSLLRAEPRGELTIPTAGSEAEFITEHYWGYARQGDGGTVEYAVEHPQWRVWEALHPSLECDVAGTYGTAYVDALGTGPSSAFIAEGSPVVVRRGRRVG